MNLLARDLKRRAEEYSETADTLLAASDFAADPKKQATVVIGKVTANMLSIISELVVYLETTDHMDAAQKRRDRIMECNNDIRIAAAKGDWETVDRIAAELGGVVREDIPRSDGD